MGRARIYLLFFCSGIAGLVYQVVWVRWFGNVFGNTIHSAALVTSVFMAGLGLGSYLAGRIADRAYARDPGAGLRLYAWAEIAIGALGLGIAFVLPNLEPLSAAWSSYELGADGWYTLSFGSLAARYAIAVVLLLPIAVLMGATLTLLIRHLVQRDLSQAGWRVGVLYGLNTLGAAVGAFHVDFLFVPTMGLTATQVLAVVINLGVGLVALRWWRQHVAPANAPAARPAAPPTPATPGEVASARGLVAATCAAIALSGFGAMGLEILWYRFLTEVLSSHRATFSLLLTVILVGIWLGSTVGGWAVRRFGRPARLYIVVQALLVVSVLAIMLAWHPQIAARGDLAAAHAAASPPVQAFIETWALLRVIIVVVGVPAFLMGFAYPLANANIQRAEASVGRRAGSLYLANTVGAVAGSLIAGFVLLPALGMQHSLLVLAGVSAAAIIPLAWTLRRAAPSADPSPGWLRPLAWVAAAGALAMLVGWARLDTLDLAQRTYTPISSTERLLTFSEDVTESVVVTELPETGARRLYTNGHSMSTTNYSAQRYMRAFAHVPLLQVADPERVLIICFGVGNTLHAASLHQDLEHLEVVDLSRHVLEHAPYFRRWNRDVLEDPRVAVFLNDGRQHLRMQGGPVYDLVTLEPPPISRAGVASLYSVEFYQLAHSRLKAGGWITQWLPAYQVPGATNLAIVRAFIDVFPDAVLLSGHKSELILLGRKGAPPTFDPRRVVERATATPAILDDLKALDLGTLTELVGTYAAGPRTLADATRGVDPITDDLPLMEYGPVGFRHTVIPAALFDVSTVYDWCPTCRSADGAPAVEHLDAYLGFTATLYRSNQFRVTSNTRAVPPSRLRPDGDPATLGRIYANSGYLQRVLPRP